MTATAAGATKRQWTAIILSVLAVALPVAAVLIVLTWAPQMPDPVAVHWGVSGQPDRFERFMPSLIGLAAVPIVLVAMALGLAFKVRKRGGAARPLVALALYFSGFGSALLLYTFGVQKGLSNAADADISGGVIVAVVLAPVLLSAAVMAIMRPAPVATPEEGPPSDLPTVALVDGTVPVWSGRTTSATWLVVLAGLLGLVPILIFAMLMKSVWLGLAAVLFIIFVYGMLAFNVTADGQGLTVASQIGWPRKSIPADKIVSASVVEVHPFKEFGGWGWRMSLTGKTGVVMKKGPGISVDYGEEDTLVITLDEGAQSAAATVNTAAVVARDEN